MSRYPRRAKLEERFILALDPVMKNALCEVAAARGMSAAALARTGIASIISKAA